MTGAERGGDRARATVLVEVPAEVAFRIFTEDIDRWWRRGVRYRVGGAGRGILALEPTVGGRLFESVETPAGTAVYPTGTVTRWEPPRRLAFEWRAVNFGPHEHTLVEIEFTPTRSGTQITVVHSGWSGIRPDHPARHGLEVGPFLRMMGLWWGDLLTSLRLFAAPTDDDANADDANDDDDPR